ncbi:MAG TPA: hypothetical protein VG518_06640, partial [Solirubrobacterales bacterium]|nr:hypothetical protein [Solirubrobacterales bacterium]
MLDPAPLALLPHSVGPYAALMVIGFAIGIGGHLFKVRWLVAAGVVLIFLGALLFPLLSGLPGETSA